MSGARCIQEIRSVVGGLEGVQEVTLGKRGEISGIIVHYDPEKTGIGPLLAAFGELPSFYEGHFIPHALDA